MDPIVVPLVILGLAGGAVSSYLSNRRVAKMQRYFVFEHMKSMTALADAAIETLAVDYKVDLKEATEAFLKRAKVRNPHLSGAAIEPGGEKFQKATANIAKLRAEKESQDVNKKQD